MPRPLAIVAEDKALIRMEAVEMLDDLGFDVLEAGHAAAALMLFEANGGAALLYTNMNMPGRLDGCRLAHEVLARWPETLIIVCSGYLDDEAAMLPAKAHFISKPCAEGLVHDALATLRMAA